jgi:hypothetical protein
LACHPLQACLSIIVRLFHCAIAGGCLSGVKRKKRYEGQKAPTLGFMEDEGKETILHHRGRREECWFLVASSWQKRRMLNGHNNILSLAALQASIRKGQCREGDYKWMSSSG